jgi:hypothetical protein
MDKCLLCNREACLSELVTHASGAGWGAVDGKLEYTDYVNYRCRDKVGCHQRSVENFERKFAGPKILFFSRSATASLSMFKNINPMLYKASIPSLYKTSEDGDVVECTFCVKYEENKGRDPERYGYLHKDAVCVGVFDNPVHCGKAQPKTVSMD